MIECWRFMKTNWIDTVLAAAAFGLPIIIISAIHFFSN